MHGEFGMPLLFLFFGLVSLWMLGARSLRRSVPAFSWWLPGSAAAALGAIAGLSRLISGERFLLLSPSSAARPASALMSDVTRYDALWLAVAAVLLGTALLVRSSSKVLRLGPIDGAGPRAAAFAGPMTIVVLAMFALPFVVVPGGDPLAEAALGIFALFVTFTISLTRLSPEEDSTARRREDAALISLGIAAMLAAGVSLQRLGISEAHNALSVGVSGVLEYVTAATTARMRWVVTLLGVTGLVAFGLPNLRTVRLRGVAALLLAVFALRVGLETKLHAIERWTLAASDTDAARQAMRSLPDLTVGADAPAQGDCIARKVGLEWQTTARNATGAECGTDQAMVQPIQDAELLIALERGAPAGTLVERDWYGGEGRLNLLGAGPADDSKVPTLLTGFHDRSMAFSLVSSSVPNQVAIIDEGAIGTRVISGTDDDVFLRLENVRYLLRQLVREERRSVVFFPGDGWTVDDLVDLCVVYRRSTTADACEIAQRPAQVASGRD